MTMRMGRAHNRVRASGRKQRFAGYGALMGLVFGAALVVPAAASDWQRLGADAGFRPSCAAADDRALCLAIDINNEGAVLALDGKGAVRNREVVRAQTFAGRPSCVSLGGGAFCAAPASDGDLWGMDISGGGNVKSFQSVGSSATSVSCNAIDERTAQCIFNTGSALSSVQWTRGSGWGGVDMVAFDITSGAECAGTTGERAVCFSADNAGRPYAVNLAGQTISVPAAFGSSYRSTIACGTRPSDARWQCTRGDGNGYVVVTQGQGDRIAASRRLRIHSEPVGRMHCSYNDTLGYGECFAPDDSGNLLIMRGNGADFKVVQEAFGDLGQERVACELMTDGARVCLAVDRSGGFVTAGIASSERGSGWGDADWGDRPRGTGDGWGDRSDAGTDDLAGTWFMSIDGGAVCSVTFDDPGAFDRGNVRYDFDCNRTYSFTDRPGDRWKVKKGRIVLSNLAESEKRKFRREGRDRYVSEDGRIVLARSKRDVTKREKDGEYRWRSDDGNSEFWVSKGKDPLDPQNLFGSWRFSGDGKAECTITLSENQSFGRYRASKGSDCFQAYNQLLFHLGTWGVSGDRLVLYDNFGKEILSVRPDGRDRFRGGGYRLRR